MSPGNLEVTYRNGQPLAAYYYLPRRPGAKSARVEEKRPGLLVDLADDGTPLGIEIAIPSIVTASDFNGVLAEYGIAPLPESDLRPLRHAA